MYDKKVIVFSYPSKSNGKKMKLIQVGLQIKSDSLNRFYRISVF